MNWDWGMFTGEERELFTTYLVLFIIICCGFGVIVGKWLLAKYVKYYNKRII